MVQALVTLNPEVNKILNIVKAKYEFKDKGQAIEYVVNKFAQLEEPELKDEFVKKMNKISTGKFITVDNFSKRYDLNVHSKN